MPSYLTVESSSDSNTSDEEGEDIQAAFELRNEISEDSIEED